jgi:hypothetical protein
MKTPRLRLEEVESVVDLLKPVRTEVSWIDVVHIVDLISCCDGLRPAIESSVSQSKEPDLKIERMPATSNYLNVVRRSSWGAPSVPGDIELQKSVAKRLCDELLRTMSLEPTSVRTASRVEGVRHVCGKLDGTVSDVTTKGVRRRGPIIDSSRTAAPLPVRPSAPASNLAAPPADMVTRESSGLSKPPSKTGRLRIVAGGRRAKMRDPVSIELE